VWKAIPPLPPPRTLLFPSLGEWQHPYHDAGNARFSLFEEAGFDEGVPPFRDRSGALFFEVRRIEFPATLRDIMSPPRVTPGPSFFVREMSERPSSGFTRSGAGLGCPAMRRTFLPLVYHSGAAPVKTLSPFPPDSANRQPRAWPAFCGLWRAWKPL